MMASTDSTTEHCNFCHRSSNEVSRMLGSPSGARICDECVAACGQILADPATPFPDFEADTDEQLIARLAPARDLVEAAAVGLQGVVDHLRERSVSWARIGQGLGVSRQAAWERFG